MKVGFISLGCPKNLVDSEVMIGQLVARGHELTPMRWGANELVSIVALGEGTEVESNPLQPYLYHDLTPRVLSTPRHFADIKIAEGCDHPCTFCVIPQYRGRFRSRRFESVISEATARALLHGLALACSTICLTHCGPTGW